MILSWFYIGICAFWGLINGLLRLNPSALVVIILWFAAYRTWQVRFPGRNFGDIALTFGTLLVIGLVVAFPVAGAAWLARSLISN